MHLKYESRSWEEKVCWEQLIQKIKTEVLGARDCCKSAKKKYLGRQGEGNTGNS